MKMVWCFIPTIKGGVNMFELLLLESVRSKLTVSATLIQESGGYSDSIIF